MTESKWIDFFCLSKLLARLDVVEYLIPEQEEHDEVFRQKLIKLCHKWKLDVAQRMDDMEKVK